MQGAMKAATTPATVLDAAPALTVLEKKKHKPWQS